MDKIQRNIHKLREREKFMKKTALLVVALMLVSMILGACSAAPAATTPAATTAAAATVAATTAAEATTAEATATPAPTATGKNFNGLMLPISTTGETILVMCTQIGEAPDTDLNKGSLPIIAEIEKRTGLKIQFNASSSDNYGTVLLPLLASGTNLPDTFIMGGADLVQMGKDGTIIDLKPLMDKDAPNTMALLEKYPLTKYAITAPEGQIWGYPNRIAPADEDTSGLNLGYRLDWIQKLGLQEPQTIDDWYNMLVAFRDKDPNGNGKADEVPFSVWSFNQLYCFAQAYGMSGMLSQWFTAKDGVITYDWTNPNGHAREWVTLMNKWFKEKLLDQSMLVDHYDAAQAQLVGDQAGAEVTWTGTFAGMTSQMKAQFPNANWMVAMPPKGPYGDQRYEAYPYINGERWMISKTAKDPDAIIKLFDYLFATDEGQILNNFGIEGTTYEMKDGVPTLKMDVVKEDHYKDPQIYMAAQGAGKLTDFVMPEAETQIAKLGMSNDIITRMGDVKKFNEYMFPSLTATTAESVALKGMTDINTTVNEYLQKFVTGSLEINDANWNEFTKKLTDEGIGDMVKIKQDQYNRFYQK